ncbi:pyrroline-5-carboxylate reductase [Lacrimispora saccharolytica]|uniref:Pyrroline-5-carboxylate reductase n=1 Tax=Lacrimispora saccharolytica (strain ATCC 35040 / DSM 2544 / NRCC 2533 / WM1) TaxID=610130 RepID=D9RAU1_LACSW|nr:pyrroline-5-carboxylate reductase [Lacrimispora saccharolytica]ADL06138.1 pyrroline-5-carboxylate reductase [[Clostridium] saccharolyticum WM1]QRV19748.1 pyrroline-5-carboxylate reductase [Lacrimispora saccharolytica]
MAEIGIIGMGNMGYAILKGLLKTYGKEDVIFTDVNRDRCRLITEELGVAHGESNPWCAGQAKYVVLAVKPQYFDPVLSDIRDKVTENHVIISIAPGITTAQLKERLGDEKRVVRAMPNTPALLGEGMTGVCYEEKAFNQEEKETIRNIFSSLGRMRLVEERLMNAVVCVSGSSPAYVYMFIEALADGAVKYGLPREAAYEMAAQTVLGSARMVLETGEHPGVLKDRVCSPGGTTIEGVSALEESGFRSAVIKAADACYKKCGKL